MSLLTVEELKEYMGTNSGVYPDQVDISTLREAGFLMYVTPIPEDFKTRIQHFGNLLAQMCYKTPVDDPKLKMELQNLAAALSYLLNSTSFQKGEYQSYDEAEMARKLRRR